MPVFTPGRRWQPPFMPFKREPFGRRVLASMEKVVKGPIWGCRMCGNCLLQETAFICPMECPKGHPQWAMWRFDVGALLRGRNAPLYVVPDL